MISFLKTIKWQWSKWLLWSCVIYNGLLLLFGVLWLFIKVNVPFLHSGDAAIIYFLISIWWILSVIFIFGFSMEE